MPATLCKSCGSDLTGLPACVCDRPHCAHGHTIYVRPDGSLFAEDCTCVPTLAGALNAHGEPVTRRVLLAGGYVAQ